MQIATWNVNSLKVRLPQVLEWLAGRPELTVLALQETKLEDHAFPKAEIEAAGFHVAFTGQKTYNGVALISRAPLEDVHFNLPNFEDPQKRVIAATVNGVRVIGAYVVNGQALDSEKYPYKLAWLDALIAYVREELVKHSNLALVGDYNIAPEDRDVHDPAKWVGEVLVSPPERERFQALLALGLADSFRLFEQAEKAFSWWDYRMMGFRRNAGLRIDHVLLSTPLVERCTACEIDKAPRRVERPSDHAPVIATLR
ncbi:exodeoxyribonuclease III [Chitinimonas sp. BJB300]|uniref:exodeoxyribonuclease III n=1 Tax=Chitinimonas sp. BJB300 TaxID=1559339 RepID=UPI000C10C12D|nr:exodeoxyribonuclease III [Chitinimonas sp. BJB300]PHV13504.1 exodeoxyribonuclease III [Chitinimonas sp. BJB300]TSJ89812.1 exodeoxyribonuclease III [Chitinimonas sp. BJB300]